MSFSGESGLRKVGLGGIHPLTQRYCAEAKMKHKQRELLAYIELESGTVLIDIVKLTRNGRSYYFQGKRWLRNQYGLGCDDCTSESGDKLNISILSRRHAPKWIEGKVLRVSERAKERYEFWLSNGR
ncbi:hypothetical protein VV1_3247 [Vibrio vulnificus CMCP6]|uniref:Uncharacterized protein n=2 Tax=Vibrio vulnificus TaxID=672 RepID=A0A3Q0MFB8_VIBVU|nr:hypothetical protein VV1_3247 [Vibrio vulnificus CMCP6]